MQNYDERIPTPAPGDINTGCTSPKNPLLIELLGSPVLPLSQEDQPERASAKVKQLERDIVLHGHHYTGIAPFVDLLKRVFARAEVTHPGLAVGTGSAGILVVRYQRNSNTAISNHSWGSAIDLTFADAHGVLHLNAQGSGQVQRGAMMLYDAFRQEGDATGEHVYWGAAFRSSNGGMSRQDGMHFEASAECLRLWKQQGKI